MRYLLDCLQVGVSVVGILFLIFVILAFISQLIKDWSKYVRGFNRQLLYDALKGFTFAIVSVMLFILVCVMFGAIIKLLIQ